MPPPPALPSNVNRQASGYTYTRSEEGHRIFSIHANKTVAFGNSDSTVLEGVYVEVFGPSGDRHDVLRTESCNYNPDSQEFYAAGRVSIELNDLTSGVPAAGLAPIRSPIHHAIPVFVETSGLSFKQEGSLAETNNRVTFRAANAAGTATGFAYDPRTGALQLNKDVVLNLTLRGGARQPPVTLTASRLTFDKGKGQFTLSGPIEVVQGTRRVSAASGTVLLGDGRRVSQARLEDGVRAEDKSEGSAIDFSAKSVQADFDPANGHLKMIRGQGHIEGASKTKDETSHLSADSLELTFTGKPPRPSGGVVSGNADLSAEAASPATSGAAPPTKQGNFPSGREELASSAIQFSFRPEMHSLQEAHTLGEGHLSLFPATPQEGLREVYAEPLVMNFDQQGRLEELRGLSKARVIAHPAQQAPPGSPDEVTSSDRLKASFDRATGALLSLDQGGNFEFVEGDRKAGSDEASYVSKDQSLTLSGHPWARDSTSQVHADHLTMDIKNGTAQGWGHVRASQIDAGPRKAAAPGPVIPTNVVADSFTAQRDSQTVRYQGRVRAWRGQDVVQTPFLEIDKRQRKLAASTGVVTSYIQATSNGGTAVVGPAKEKAEIHPVTIRADRVDYLDADRKAIYSGHVELETENSTLRADRMDVFFSRETTAEASAVERATADGHVAAVQPGRRASGDHAEYFAAPGKIVMTGGPPTVYDATNGFVSGRSLTLFLHDDTILVDGGGQSPTISKRSISP